MTASLPGMVGAAVGLLLALITYVAMAYTMQRPLTDPATSPEDRASAERSWSIVRVILLADFVILGAVGYYVGGLLAS